MAQRRLIRLAVTPEEIGLCGCWQIIAVKRETLNLCQQAAEPAEEIGYYVSSLSPEERNPEALATLIRGHWSAIENGTHYRRDVTLGEDACRTKDRGAAAVLASLRNLTNGIYELARARERTRVDTLRSWCQQQIFSTAWSWLND